MRILVIAAMALFTGLAAPARTLAQEPLTLGARHEGRLEPSDTTDSPGGITKLMPLSVPAGTRLKVSVESPDFDAYAALVIDVGGHLVSVAMNDDHPGLASSTDALVRQVVEEGPAYAVLVTSFDGTGTGSFTVTVAAAAPGEEFPIPVEPGTRVDGQLDDDDARTADGIPMETYEFQADALDRILVLAEGDAVPTLAVSAPEHDGTLASASWKDGFSFLEWMAPETGTYRLTVTPSDAGGGSFSLRIWAPPVTAAELDGLVVDDEIHHDGYGFSLPSPGPGFAPQRGLADPHQTYLDGYRRLWYLADDEGAVLTVLYLGSFGPLEDGTFKQVSSDFIRGFATGQEPRIKEEGERSVRGVIAAPSGSGTQARCIGSSSAESPGRMLCVSLSAEAALPATDDLLNGMVLR